MARNDQLLASLRYVRGLMGELAQLAEEARSLAPRPAERELPEPIEPPRPLDEEEFSDLCANMRGGARQMQMLGNVFLAPSPETPEERERRRCEARARSQADWQAWERKHASWEREVAEVRSRNAAIRERNRSLEAYNAGPLVRQRANVEARMEQVSRQFAAANETGWYPPRFCTIEACDWFIDAVENQIVHDDSELASAYIDHLRWERLLEGQQHQYDLTRQALSELRAGQESNGQRLDALRAELDEGNLALADQIRRSGARICDSVWTAHMLSDINVRTAVDTAARPAR